MCKRKGLLWVGAAVVVLLIDQAAKYWILQHLRLGEPWEITSFFNLTLAYNTGAAFSFLHDASGWQNIFFCLLAGAASIAILIWLARHAAREFWLPNFALSMIMGGAIGNVIDRLQYGYVIDFLDFHWRGWHFAIFNTADSAIFLGAVLMILYWNRATKHSSKN